MSREKYYWCTCEECDYLWETSDSEIDADGLECPECNGTEIFKEENK